MYVQRAVDAHVFSTSQARVLSRPRVANTSDTCTFSTTFTQQVRHVYFPDSTHSLFDYLICNDRQYK